MPGPQKQGNHSELPGYEPVVDCSKHLVANLHLIAVWTGWSKIAVGCFAEQIHS